MERISHVARFSLLRHNTYYHCKVLVIIGSAIAVHIKEGITKGDPLSMILHDIIFLPIIQALQHHVQVIALVSWRDMPQVWYVYHSVMDS